MAEAGEEGEGETGQAGGESKTRTAKGWLRALFFAYYLKKAAMLNSEKKV